MRRTHPLEVLALAAVIVPTIGFGVACMPIGCGDAEPPTRPSTESGDPSYDEVLPVTGADTGGEPVFEVCGGEADLDLFAAGTAEPMPEVVELVYGSGCGQDHGVYLDVAPRGLRSGAIDVAWTVSIDGFDPMTGADTWDMGCTEEGGMDPGTLSIALPVDADGAAVTVDVIAVDADGTEAAGTTTFLVTIVDRSAER